MSSFRLLMLEFPEAVTLNAIDLPSTRHQSIRAASSDIVAAGLCAESMCNVVASGCVEVLAVAGPETCVLEVFSFTAIFGLEMPPLAAGTLSKSGLFFSLSLVVPLFFWVLYFYKCTSLPRYLA